MSYLVQDETLEEDDKYYQLSETSIKDKSMLGRHGQELCDNVDVHWLTQTCDAPGNGTGMCVAFSHVRVLTADQ